MYLLCWRSLVLGKMTFPCQPLWHTQATRRRGQGQHPCWASTLTVDFTPFCFILSCILGIFSSTFFYAIQDAWSFYLVEFSLCSSLLFGILFISYTIFWSYSFPSPNSCQIQLHVIFLIKKNKGKKAAPKLKQTHIKGQIKTILKRKLKISPSEDHDGQETITILNRLFVFEKCLIPRNPSASDSRVLGLEVCTARPRLSMVLEGLTVLFCRQRWRPVKRSHAVGWECSKCPLKEFWWLHAGALACSDTVKSSAW